MKGFYLSFAVLAGFGLSGCGGGGSALSGSISNDTTKLTGSFGTSYAYYQPKWYQGGFITKAYAVGYGQVKKAVAVPLLGSYVDITRAKDVTIESDGTFSVGLDKKLTDPEGNKVDTNWIVLVEKNDGTINFLGIPNSDGSESLLNLPISKSTGDISFGDVDSSGNEARTNLKIDGLSAKVSYEAAELDSLAKTDDVVKAVINSYKNNLGKTEDKHITVRLTVIAEGNFTQMATGFSKASQYRGYAINIQGGSNTVLKQNFTNICSGNKQMSLELPSGQNITFANGGGTNLTTLTSSAGTQNGSSCSDTSGIFQEQIDEDGGISLNFGGGSKIVNSLTVPNGMWTLRFDGQNLGTYNLAYSLPVANGSIKLPTPAVKLDLDSADNNKTKGFYIKWYIGNIEVPNKIVSEMIPQATIYTQASSGLAVDCSVAMTDTNGTLKSYISISECKENGNAPADRYYKPASGSGLKALESVYVRYETPGNEVRFSYDDI